MMNPYLQQHQNRGRINSGSTGSSSSVGYGIGNNQQYQKEPMTYGAVVASGAAGTTPGCHHAALRACQAVDTHLTIGTAMTAKVGTTQTKANAGEQVPENERRSLRDSKRKGAA